MKKFCKDLRTHATKIINYEKKKMIPLTTEEKIYHNEQENCYICKKEFDKSDKISDKIIVVIQVNVEEQLMIYVI